MLKAIIVTFIIFAILFSGIIALKRSANHWKVPKGVKPQPYDEDESDNHTQKDSPQLTDQSTNDNNKHQADNNDKS